MPSQTVVGSSLIRVRADYQVKLNFLDFFYYPVWDAVMLLLRTHKAKLTSGAVKS